VAHRADSICSARRKQCGLEVTKEEEAAMLTYRIRNLLDQRDHAMFEIKECERRLQQLALAKRKPVLSPQLPKEKS